MYLIEELERHLRLYELVERVDQETHISVQAMRARTEAPPRPAAAPSNRELGRALRADLARLASSPVVLTDTFEKAARETCAWVEQWLLNALVDPLRRAVVVLSGRPECEQLFVPASRWTVLSETRYRLSELEDDDIYAHFEQQGRPLEQGDVTLLAAARASPAKMAQLSTLLVQTLGRQP